MPDPVLLVITLFACLGGDILRKWFMGKHGNSQWKVFACNAASSLISCLVLLAWGGISKPSSFTLWLSLIFGTVTALQAIATMQALKLGPMAYTTVFICCSTIITALSGFFFFGETIELPQYVGMGLMLISFFLAVDKKKNDKKASLRWLAFCFIAFCCSGAVGIMQKTESTNHKDELGTFLVIAFAVAFLFSAIVALFFRSKEKKLPAAKDEPPLFAGKTGLAALIVPGAMILMGICAGINNQLNLFLAGKMDAAIFFPIVNGVGLVLSSIAGVVVFRDKLSLKQWIGVVCGIASVVLLCNPFKA